MKSVKYLELVREKHHLKNDAALAKYLGVGSSAMSHYMSGRRVMDEETCLAVAMALDIEPTKVLMAAGIDRAEKTGQKSLWEVFSQRMAITASLILVVNLFLTPEKAEAAPLLTYSSANASSSLYYVKLPERTMSNRHMLSLG